MLHTYDDEVVASEHLLLYDDDEVDEVTLILYDVLDEIDIHDDDEVDVVKHDELDVDDVIEVSDQPMHDDEVDDGVLNDVMHLHHIDNENDDVDIVVQ